MGFSKFHGGGAGLSAIAASAVLALGAVACGSDDDADDGDAGAGAAKAADTGAKRAAESGSGPRAAYAKFTDSIYSMDYEAACAQMTAKHRREVVGDGDCANRLRTLFRGRPPRGERPKVVAMKVDGNRATLRTRSEDSFRPYPIDFVKRGGEWKVDSSLSAPGGGS
ncbi:MAG TPA: hypothetical protein VHF88_02465 [Thermoleophilaceae bacterium]|nr:hypothetical protein [Thermoleophilaceae bacterium]